MSILGSMAGLPALRPDWAQTDENSADYIRNKPDFSPLEELGREALSLAERALPKTGGTLEGELRMGGNKISGLPAPESATDPATKAYVDERVKTITVTIPASGWYDIASGVEYTLLVDGILPTDEPIMDMAYPSHSLEYMPELIAVEEEFAKIYFAVTGQDTMWIRAKDRPEKDIPIKIKVVR